jgi:NAD(P)-dependent dehydrogenase (short-subunit alcohol dehydrogenase family)
LSWEFSGSVDFGLQDKAVIVTGGAKGIGAAIARSCGKEGCLPVIVDRDEAATAKIQQEFAESNVQCEAFVTDLSDSANCLRILESIVKKVGRIDALVNNAGVNDGVGLESGTPERFANSLKSNLVHYYAMTYAALPYLKLSRGAIVNIGSKVAITGQGGTSGYAAAKGAILELTTEWAEELAPHGIRVNAVIPSEVMTPMYREWSERHGGAEELQRVAARVPLGRRFTEADEVASMVLFYLSSTSKISEQFAYVDGGYVHLDRRLS